MSEPQAAAPHNADLVARLRVKSAYADLMGLPVAELMNEAADAIEYAWECAENMRGWAQRAEATNRKLREELFRLG